MSNISSACANQPVELAPSRWPLRLWWLAAALILTALLHSGLAVAGQLLAGTLLFAIGVQEWRRRRQLVSLQFSAEEVHCTLSCGATFQASWPLPGMANRYWVSFALPARYRQRVWLTVFADQLGADDFRRLRVMMRR